MHILNETSRIIENGIFYTPDPLAELLTESAIENPNVSVLDPSCGEGVLLKAAEEKIGSLKRDNSFNIVGCDLFKPKSLNHGIQFVQSNFFEFNCSNKFDLILTNPPYIQYGRLKEKDRNHYYEKYAKPFGFNKHLDLWAYFLIKSLSHLNKGGTLAAILPWSLLEADFSKKVRSWLAENFGNIKTLSLSHAHFENTEKRVLLLWLKNYGIKVKKIEIGFSDTINDNHTFKRISKNNWIGSNALIDFNLNIPFINESLESYGFKELKNYCDISIGVVTGANDYFILPEKEAESLGFSKNCQVPILTTGNELKGLVCKVEPSKVLIQFNRMTHKRAIYINKGKRLKVHKRSHSQRREKSNGTWYKIDPGDNPDAYFTYRASAVPFLALNGNGTQCTNSLHRIYFKRLNMSQKKWIQLSLLSLFGQLGLEANARHYGNGIIKIEPTALKSVLVFSENKKVPNDLYNNISKLIGSGKKGEAVKEATSFVVDELSIDNVLLNHCIRALNCIRKRRGSSKVDQI